MAVSSHNTGRHWCAVPRSKHNTSAHRRSALTSQPSYFVLPEIITRIPLVQVKLKEAQRLCSRLSFVRSRIRHDPLPTEKRDVIRIFTSFNKEIKI
jgi:hypothetical protein